MDQTLSEDVTLRAVAALFPRPAARPVVRATVRQSHRRVAWWPRPMRLGVALAATGLILATITALLGLPSVAAVGIALWLCGGVVFVTCAARRGLGKERSASRRRTRSGGDADAREDTDNDEYEAPGVNHDQ